MNTALLLIDIQNDYFPRGKMALEGALEAAENAATLLFAFRAANQPVIHIQHIATKPDAPFFLPDTPGVEIHSLVEPAAGEPVFIKAFPNSFRETGLLEYLHQHQIQELVVVGMMTQRCIDTTVRAAFDLHFSVQLVHDACATRSLSFNGELIPACQVQGAFMAALGVGFARVVDTQQILADLATPFGE
jgi:nicotinamidase-related amidase